MAAPEPVEDDPIKPAHDHEKEKRLQISRFKIRDTVPCGNNQRSSTIAVSIGSQVIHMLMVMIVGLAIGTTVSTAQVIGMGERRQAAKDVSNPLFPQSAGNDTKILGAGGRFPGKDRRHPYGAV